MPAAPVVARLLSSHQVVRASGMLRPREVLSTGIAALDRFLPGHGLPRGGVTEIVGPAGKLEIALHALACNSRTFPVAFASSGGIVSPERLVALGADLDACRFLVEPDGERLLWCVEQVVGSGLFPLMILYASRPLDCAPLLHPTFCRRILGQARQRHAAVVVVLDDHPHLAGIVRPCSLRLGVERGSQDAALLNQAEVLRSLHGGANLPCRGKCVGSLRMTGQGEPSRAVDPVRGGRARRPLHASPPPGDRTVLQVTLVKCAGHAPGGSVRLEVAP